MQASSTGILPNIDYPPPPRVHWVVLLAAYILFAVLITWFVPNPWQGFVQSLVVDAWTFYLCLWIRSLDAEARSLFWCSLYVFVQSAFSLMDVRPNPSIFHQFVVLIFLLSTLVLGINTLYQIRADLLNHYNKREPIGLYLGGVMTWFFSFFYIQSQLYPIALYKQRQAEGIVENSGSTSLR